MISVKIYKVDPYTEAGGLIASQLAQRLVKGAEEHDESIDTVKDIISRLWRSDPSVIALVALDSKGQVKGHAVGLVENAIAYLFQPRLDEPTEGDTIGEFLALAEKWLKEYNSILEGVAYMPGINLLANRADPKWAKKYGFKTKKYVMFKSLGE